MTNIFKTPKKVKLKTWLLEIGISALEKDGWVVSRVPGAGSSVRLIERAGRRLKVSIRTSQDTWIAFPRTDDGKRWKTLSGVDAVVAVSVDDQHNPRFAQVHMIDGAEMRERFDRAYKARKDAGHTIPVGRGVWVSLYHEDAESPPRRVGAGAGLEHPAFARVPLEASPVDAVRSAAARRSGSGDAGDEGRDQGDEHSEDPRPNHARGARERSELLTIPEAKRRLAITFGVKPENIKISVEA